MDWLKYKSGTDIRFTAVTTDAQAADVTPDVIFAMAGAFATWLKAKTQRTGLKIAVGHDCRVSAEWIATSVKDALVQSGITVYDCGLCSTPSMFMMTQYPSTRADGSIMITASHHPFDKNGLKFFTPQGGLEGSDIADILALAQKELVPAETQGTVLTDDYMALYTDDLVAKVRAATGREKPLQGLKIVVDAGNGAGGFYTSRVLDRLGADTAGSQFLEPDGTFPNHIPNPENKVAMKAISDCVLREGADLGIIFDTDVDRAAIVAPDGKEINRNRLIALIGAVVLREYPGATIVTDSVTSDGLADFIKARGGVHRRFKRGYKNVINEAVRIQNEGGSAPLAIETSGHAALSENYYLDDGAYLVTKILISLCNERAKGGNLLDLIADLVEPVEECEVRLRYTVEDWKQAGIALLNTLEQSARAREDLRVADDSCEGVRVSSEQGFFLIRMSVHDPVLPVNFEAKVAGGVKALQELLYGFVKDNTAIDLTALVAAMKNGN